MANNKGYSNFSFEESDIKIKEGFAKHIGQDTAALAMITTYNPAKITPTKAVIAQIGLLDELGMEDAIAEIKSRNINKLFLLINSFGGGVMSSFKIARALRENFDDIVTFVPHIAASGGTLIALTGNKIVMGDMSSISPIDVQLPRNGGMYSVNAMIRGFYALNELFSKTSEEDAPYPWKALADKLDPVEFQEWMDSSKLMKQHATEILKHNKSSFKDNAESIVGKLSDEYPTHQYAITYNEAKNVLGEALCCKNTEYDEVWGVMKLWLRKYIANESGTHIIRYLLPDEKATEKI